MVDLKSASDSYESRHSRGYKLSAILTRLHLIAPARTLNRMVRRVIFAVVSFLRKLARTPVLGRGIRPLLVRIDGGNHPHFELDELLKVCSELNRQKLRYWVTSGWGLDVLVGCETRRHSNLNLALDRFSENLPSAVAVLNRLGYERKRMRKKALVGTVWFPDTETFVDSDGRHVEVHSISWDVLAVADSMLGSPSASSLQSNRSEASFTPGLIEKCTQIGSLKGAPIPTLSVAAQQLFRLGYTGFRPKDTHSNDLIRILTRRNEWDISLIAHGNSSMNHAVHIPSTLLLVPIFTFPAELWRLCRSHRNNLDLVPPHVTLAFPFLPLESVTTHVLARLSEIFEAVPAFDFELERVKWFDTAVVYLEPTNSHIFRSITESLQREFPDFHPYDDAFDSVIPHVCLAEDGTLADRRIVSKLTPQYLPIAAHASHVWLMSDERRLGEWSIAKIFTFGSTSHIRVASLQD